MSVEEKDSWISSNISEAAINQLINSDSKLEMNSHTIAKELYKMGITYSSMLDPVVYDNLPKV